jgi:DNA-binding response OmpR family regulator
MLMPKMDGVETIIALRRIDAGARIIAISGGGSLFQANNCLQIAQSLGANETLLKPFSTDYLSACINAALL